MAEQYDLPFLEIDTGDIDLKVARLLNGELARRFSAVPISRLSDGALLLAIADPATVLFSDELRSELGSPPRFAVSRSSGSPVPSGSVRSSSIAGR